MCILVGVAFAQFVGIVVYHTWLHVSKVLAKKFTLCLKQDGRAAEGNEQCAYQLML